MPVNTEEAVSSGPPNRYEQIQARLSRRREQARRSTSGAQGNETANINAESIVGAIDDARAAATSAATSALGELTEAVSSAANTFTVGYEAGQVDPRLAAAIADRAVDTPSPSTVQATNATATATTTPSLAGQQNRSFTTLSPRPYFRIDPLDIRYDFLTGQKVNTTGGQPNINTPSSLPGGGNTSGGTNPDGTAGVANETFYNEFGDSYTQAETTGATYNTRSGAEIGAKAEGWSRSQLRRVVIDNGDGTFSVLSKV